MKIKLANGMEVEGEKEELIELIKELNEPRARTTMTATFMPTSNITPIFRKFRKRTGLNLKEIRNQRKLKYEKIFDNIRNSDKLEPKSYYIYKVLGYGGGIETKNFNKYIKKQRGIFEYKKSRKMILYCGDKFDTGKIVDNHFKGLKSASSRYKYDEIYLSQRVLGKNTTKKGKIRYENTLELLRNLKNPEKLGVVMYKAFGRGSSGEEYETVRKLIAKDNEITELKSGRYIGTKYFKGTEPETKYKQTPYRKFMSDKIKYYTKQGIFHTDAFRMAVNDWNKFHRLRATISQDIKTSLDIDGSVLKGIITHLMGNGKFDYMDFVSIYPNKSEEDYKELIIKLVYNAKQLEQEFGLSNKLIVDNGVLRYG